MTGLVETLPQLWEEVKNCKLCEPQYLAGTLTLKHMSWVGKKSEPDIMFVLMNPIALNPTLHKTYDGALLPFAGRKAFWKVLVEANLLPEDLLAKIKTKPWNDQITSVVIEALIEKNYYITELVKCPSQKAIDPDNEQVKTGLDILKREIDLVQPKRIVTFGLLVFQALTGQKVKLKEYLEQLRNGQAQPFYVEAASGQKYEVFPCYFPTGRGNSKGAIECLKIISGL